MRTRIEVNPREINRIVRIINTHVNEKVFVKNLLIELLVKKVSSSDYFFILLSKLQELDVIDGKRDFILIKKNISEKLLTRLKKGIIEEVEKRRKIFVTPLEVAKFYQCPRRFYLEKITMSKEFKKERGRAWNGEVLHLATQMFINNLMKRRVRELITEIPRIAMNRYKGKITIKEKTISNFLLKLYRLIRDEKFDILISERTLLSMKRGLIGTPDIIAGNERWIPIDVKLGKIDKRGIKKEHLLQSVGEALLIEDFLRSRIDECYLIYFQSSSVVKVKLTKELKKEFMFYKRGLEKVAMEKNIPPMSKLSNARSRVCRGCHVKPVCDHIEELARLKKINR